MPKEALANGALANGALEKEDRMTDTAPTPVLYDPDLKRGLLKRAFTQAVPVLFGIPDGPLDPELPLPEFRPPTTHRFGRGIAHYGIMIPDLPAPHHFMANMMVIGYAGIRAFDVDAARRGRARDTATLGHGTAATTHDPFSVYGADETHFAPDGSLLQFG